MKMSFFSKIAVRKLLISKVQKLSIIINHQETEEEEKKITMNYELVISCRSFGII